MESYKFHWNSQWNFRHLRKVNTHAIRGILITTVHQYYLKIKLYQAFHNKWLKWNIFLTLTMPIITLETLPGFHTLLASEPDWIRWSMKGLTCHVYQKELLWVREPSLSLSHESNGFPNVSTTAVHILECTPLLSRPL